MNAAAAPGLKKSFALDPDVLGPNSSANLELGGTTDADVVLAVSTDTPFPDRPNGIIDLAHISLNASGANPAGFQGGEVLVAFQFSAGVTAGAAIFDRPQDALAALNLGETPGLNLTIGAAPDSRFVLLRSGYQASGSVTGSHPIGAIGSFTFGASGAASGVSAVLHRFPKSAGADTVLKDTVRSWKLPRHVASADKLAPATWILAEATGSLAVNLAASLGYNFNFVRQAKAFGLSGDIGLKIDAAATASFGFDVSGRYLVVVGRESDSATDPHLRLRMFKLSANGMQFGLNLKVGVTGVEGLTPNSVDDFVKAVFGVHGAQILTALGQLEKWTDPNQNVGHLVAGLANDKALELIKSATGIDPQTAFNDARNKLLNAINLYQALPSKVSSGLLGILNQLSPQSNVGFQKSLTLLASTDPQMQIQELTHILNTPSFANMPAAQFLSALADQSLLNLFDRLPEVRAAASTALSILDGQVIAGLQQFINDKLDLRKVLSLPQQADFNQLDSFLIGRLSAFFDKTLGPADLDEIKKAINIVVGKRQEIYAKAVKALNSTYGFGFASTWQSTSSSTAVLDVVFDTSDPAARQMLQTVVGGSRTALDELFTTQLASVQFNAAVLSHELRRKSTLEISLPRFNFQTQSVTTALANAHPEDDGGRILVYDATGSNTISVRNKFSSSLTVMIAARTSPDLRVHSTDGNSWSYRLLYAKPTIKREELEAITRPFITQYLADQFAGTSLSTWYNELETTSEKVLHNGPEVYGDLCASFEVSLPGEALTAWMSPVNNVPAAARRVSVAIQKAMKMHLPLFYLRDIGKLGNLASSAPLLAWASIPPAFSFDGSSFNSGSGHDVFWDHVDINLRRAAALHPFTTANLLVRLPDLRLRLEEAGMHGTVQFYQNDQAGTIQSSAVSQFGDTLLESLLLCEAMIVEKANDALKDIQKFLSIAGTSPTHAVDRLSTFAADITTAFNKLIGSSVFADLSIFRAVAQVIFAEATTALSGGRAVQPRTMLTLDILTRAPPRTFQLADFLNGAIPADADIAVPQRLVSA